MKLHILLGKIFQSNSKVSIFYIRCDGSISNGGRKSQILRRLVKEVALLPSNESVTLLDISIQNVTKLPGKLFQNLNLELSGLVVSTGALSNIDKKVCLCFKEVILLDGWQKVYSIFSYKTILPCWRTHVLALTHLNGCSISRHNSWDSYLDFPFYLQNELCIFNNTHQTISWVEMRWIGLIMTKIIHTLGIPGTGESVEGSGVARQHVDQCPGVLAGDAHLPHQAGPKWQQDYIHWHSA